MLKHFKKKLIKIFSESEPKEHRIIAIDKTCLKVTGRKIYVYSTVNAHAGDCSAYPTKVCCEYKSYIETGISPENIMEVLPGEIVDVFMYVKNNYKNSNTVNIDFEAVHNELKDVTDDWKKTM